MALTPDRLKLIKVSFGKELNGYIKELESGLLILEQDASQVDQYDALIRCTHNIKGPAKGLGLEDLNLLAHTLESLFDKLKVNEVELSQSLIDISLLSIDRIKHLYETDLAGKTISFDFKNHIEALDQAIKGKELFFVNIGNESSGSEDENQMGSEEYVSDLKVDTLSALSEEVQLAYISLASRYDEAYKIDHLSQVISQTWGTLAENIHISDDSQSQSLEQFGDQIEHIRIGLSKHSQLLRSTRNHLNFSSKAIRHQIRDMRMIPIKTELDHLKRVSRDLAKELGKKIKLEVHGEDIEIDRKILENIREPLLHILRNALDHGIETPEERLRKNKDEQGRVNIDVKLTGGHVSLTISDDGNGINVDLLVSTVKEKGLMSDKEIKNINPENMLDLIFLPGLSTASEVSDISGRGAGMDVVRYKIEELRGKINLQSVYKKGSSINIKLPITLAAEHGIIVLVGNDQFVIPTSCVSAVVDVKLDDIIFLNGGKTYPYENSPLPLRSLSDLISIPKLAYKKSTMPAVVISVGQRQVVLLVDDIMGEKEIIVKPLNFPLNEVPNIKCGTLSTNGEVLLVVDVPELINSVYQGSSLSNEEKFVKREDSIPHLLVVDDSATTRALEKNTLVEHGFKVSTAVNGNNALQTLRQIDCDLVITDIQMPIMNGFELTASIKSDKDLKNLPVIIVSTLMDDESKQKGIDNGADAYIIKSHFESQKLIDTVNRLL